MPEEIAIPPPHRLQRWFVHVVVLVCVVGFAAVLLGVLNLLVTGNNPPGRDVISFWVAGRQIAAHADPYNAVEVLRMERSAGFAVNAQALIMRNPPSALPLALPLAPFQLRGASLLWSLLLLASLALSVHLFWITIGRPANHIHLLGYSFGPALVCILGGQTAVFALLGLVLFLHLNRTHSFAAGISLWLCALKPHLFLPFGIVVLLWAAHTRRYRLLAGAVLALAASSALATWLDPSIWTQYREMMRTPNIQAEFVPCLSYALRAIHPRSAWLQYFPAAAGCCWAIWFYRRRRETWDWIQDGALLMLVSLVVSPYAWVTDHAILIPALLVGAYRATTQAQLGVMALAGLLVEVAQFTGKNMHSPLYIVFPPFWLAWYLYVIWQQHRSCRSQGDGAPDKAFTEMPALRSL